MKSKSFAWFIMSLVAAILTIPRVTFAQDQRRYERREEWRHGYSRDDRRRLEGTWYLNGERDKPCEVVSTRGGFEARNERGETSRLVYDGYGSIRAHDWEGGLRGDVRRHSIEWANGTTWTRVASRR
jgi:YD repeat-containing protein